MKPKKAQVTEKELENRRELLQQITEGLDKRDMILVAARLSGDGEQTKVLASSVFEGKRFDILHLLGGLNEGVSSLRKDILVKAISGKVMPSQAFDDPSYA